MPVRCSFPSSTGVARFVHFIHFPVEPALYSKCSLKLPAALRNRRVFIAELAQDVRFYLRPKIVSHTPTSFPAKTDGPNWATDPADMPNLTRIGSPKPLERSIQS